MPAYAKSMLNLMYEWIREATDCSSNLIDLALELESLREKCNFAETVGSTSAAAGTVLSVIAAPFTGGSSLLFGLIVGGIGAGVSVVSKIIEAFESSSKLDRVRSIDERCNEIAAEMKSQYFRLRRQCRPSIFERDYFGESSDEKEDETDQRIVKEFLKAMLRRMKLNVGLDVENLDRFVKEIINSLFHTSTNSPSFVLVLEVISVLSAFSLKLGGSAFPAIAAAGGIQIGKAVIGTGASAALLGLVGLGINLYESIRNWKELIKNNHETDASKSLRDTAKKINKVKTMLSDKLSLIEKMLRDAVKQYLARRQSTSQTNQAVKSKTAAKSASKLGGSKSVNYSKFSSSSQAKSKSATASGPPGDDDKETSSDSCSDWTSSSESESSSDSESEFESSSDVEQVLKMALVNARSLNKFTHQGNAKYSPATITDVLKKNQLDVFLITETWLKGDSLTNPRMRRLLPSGYNMYHIARPFDHGKRRGGGVAVIHRYDLGCVPVSFDMKIKSFEYIATAIKPSDAREPVLILNIYRPPGGSISTFINNFLEDFQSLMSKVYQKYKNVVIGGDFNVWVDKVNKKAQKFKELTHENILFQRVLQSTHKNGHTLDLILARPNVRVTIVSVEKNDFSDHHTVIFLVNLRLKKKKSFKK